MVLLDQTFIDILNFYRLANAKCIGQVKSELIFKSKLLKHRPCTCAVFSVLGTQSVCCRRVSISQGSCLVGTCYGLDVPSPQMHVLKP